MSAAPNRTPGPWLIKMLGKRAYVCNADGRNVVDVGAVGTADARLIAAAPDLLAIIAHLVACYQSGNDIVLREAFEDANRAVAKLGIE